MADDPAGGADRGGARLGGGDERSRGVLQSRHRDGEGVRGTVPQKIRVPADRPVDLMFRPAAVYRNSAAVVECGGKELCRKKAMIFTPGEMALVTLKPEQLRGLPGDTLTVRIERN